MSLVALNPQQVAKVESLLEHTGEAVEKEAQAAADEITGLSGTWSGAGASAAFNQQYGPFASASRRLYDEILHIGEALGLSRRDIQFEDEVSEQGFTSIEPDSPMPANFSRL